MRVVAAAVALLASVWLAGCGNGDPDGPATPDKPLAQTAEEVNATLPKMVDAHIRLDQVAGGPGKTFDYYFTLVDARADDLNAAAVQAVVPQMKAAVMRNRDMGMMLKHGITIAHHYRRQDGSLIFEFSVTPADLSTPAMEAQMPTPASGAKPGAVMVVVGWILWGAALLLGLGALASSTPDGGVRSMMRVQGLVMLAACAVTLFFPISKLWVLLAAPVAFVVPLILVGARAASLESRMAALKREADATGVPLVDLLEPETRRMEGEEY